MIGAERAIWRVVAALALICCWAAAGRLVGEQSLPGPGATLSAGIEESSTGPFWAAVGQTLESTLLGLVIAAAIAVPLGLFIGSHRFATDSSRVSIDFLASIPPVSFLPLALLLFGPGLPMKLVLIGYGASWPLLVRTIAALRDVDPLQHDVADAFGLVRRVRWGRLYLPAALPGILIGLRVSLTISLLLSVVGEYIGGAAGIGAELTRMQVAGRADDAMALAIVTAVLGVVLNLGMTAVERITIAWHPSVRLTRAA
jgi:ABC-type nitrate/sulfonate/bicarbonate transport system permease component